MPKHSCCVPGCLNSFPKAIQGITWHPFPKNEALAKKWMSRIGRRDLKVNERPLVCSDHFEEKDFKRRSSRTESGVLKLTAVPSIVEGENYETMSRGKENCKNNENKVDNLHAANSLEAEYNSESKARRQRTLEAIRNFDNEDLDFGEATNFSEELIENSQDEAKVECVFLNLPLDVLEHIFGYLSSNDLISLSSVCKVLQRSVQALKQRFDFTAYYPLNTKSLLEYTLSTTCMSINLNHCYWLKPSTILDIISKTNLVHFHVIECDVNEDVIEAICDLHLKSLSFSYTREWQSFFQGHLNGSIRCFKMLNNLEVFDNTKTSILNTILFNIYESVLHHCKELQHLRVFASNKKACSAFGGRQLPLPLRLSPVPKLKSLVIDVNDFRLNLERIMIFLNLILNDKVIPLEHFDIGEHICKLYLCGFLPHPKILSDKSTLLLRDVEDFKNNKSDFNFWTNFAGFKDCISHTKYKKIFIRGVLSEGVDEFFQNVIPKSRSSLKELNVDFNFSCQLFNSLSSILIRCPQITVLDVSELFREYLYSQNILDNCFFQQQVALLDAISNLKNLKVLNMHCHILHCKQDGQFPNTLPFWKVTKACSKLIELRILNGHSYIPNYCNIDENILYDVAHCKDLRLLRLISFNIISSEQYVDLSKITRSCKRLQNLKVFLVSGIDVRTFEQSLIHAVNLKVLSITLKCDVPLPVNEIFFDNLGKCENLESLFLDGIKIGAHDHRNLLDTIFKLKNLCIVSFGRGYANRVTIKTDDIYKKIVEERAAFLFFINFSDNWLYRMPEKQWELR